MAADPGLTAARWLGRPLRRREDERILRGGGRYVDDIERPGLIHVAFVRSPHARARIRAVRKPEAVPGLVAVLTAGDLGDARALPLQSPPGVRHADAPHPLLAGSEARYAGQAVAAVVAESRALAEDFAELVEVDFEPLDPVVEPESGREELLRFERTAGDVDGAFAAAAHVVSARHAIPRLVAAPIEPRGIVAEHDRAADLLTVWLSAQDTHRPLAHLAHALRRPQDAIRVIVPDVGGAFGSKGAIAPEAVVAAIAAMRLGRPVKWTEDRLENFVSAYQGRGLQGEVQLALDGDGRMLALRARVLADMGAYLFANSAAPVHTTAMLMCGCYAIPAAAVSIVGARTDKVPVGPYRGAGRPEAAYLVERTVDEAARRLGLDPVELRRRNLVRKFPHRTPLGWSYDSGDYERCLGRALELAQPERAAGPERAVGAGVAMYVERAAGDWEGARIVVEPNGRVIAHSGSSPHGQGHETTFAQIVADALGLDPADVVMRFGDSAVVPRGVGTYASRSTAMGGSALLVAAQRVLERCTAVAARLLEVPAEDVTVSDGRFSAGAGRELTFRAVAAAAYDPARLGPDFEPGLEASARFASGMVFGSGAYAALVEIERATGALQVRRIAAVDDAGRIVNPLLAEGQVIGATVQGLGASVTEEAVHDAGGQMTSASLLDYALPTAAEVPEIATAFVESPSPLNPLGAKGIGEGGAIGAPAAIANAVADALGGRRVDPPFTADKLWEALQERPDRPEGS